MANSSSQAVVIDCEHGLSNFAYLKHVLATSSEHIAKANESLITTVQIERAAGVNSVDEICQVDGVGESSPSYIRR